MKKEKIPFWKDPKAPLALDCELAAAVNKAVWRWMHLGLIRMSSKLDDLGFETTFHNCHTVSDHWNTAEMLAGYDRQMAMDSIYALPLGLKRSNPSYAKRQRIRKLAEKARLIYFGSLTEVNFGRKKWKAEQKGASPCYLTSYAVFRVCKTNKCLVHVFYYARSGL